MRNTKAQAFTLVELIVVITILAILGTIAFISLQGYSADARNSKRTQDLSSIQGAMQVGLVNATPLMSFVTGTVSKMDSIALGGAADVSVADAEYNAGTPAYTVLNVVAKDFKDPQGAEYRIGATTKAGSKFQLSATIEKDGVDEAIVAGDFNPRNADTHSGSISGYIFTLSDTDANSLKKGDAVITNGTALTTTVSKVSRDGVTVTLAAKQVADDATNIRLVIAESAGLIEASRGLLDAVITDGTNTAVVNGSGATLAY